MSLRPLFGSVCCCCCPNSMLVSAADERIGRSAEGTLVWIIDLVGYSWRAEMAGCRPAQSTETFHGHRRDRRTKRCESSL